MTEILLGSEPEYEEEFDSLVDTGGSTVVLFTAPTWCVPCRRFEPHWQRAREELPELTFIRVDMGGSPEDTGHHWATERFGIRGVPQVKLFLPELRVETINARAVVPLIKELKQYG